MTPTDADRAAKRQLADANRRIAELEAGLRPFANYAENLSGKEHGSMQVGYYGASGEPAIVVDDICRAAALLAGKVEKSGSGLAQC